MGLFLLCRDPLLICLGGQFTWNRSEKSNFITNWTLIFCCLLLDLWRVVVLLLLDSWIFIFGEHLLNLTNKPNCSVPGRTTIVPRHPVPLLVCAHTAHLPLVQTSWRRGTMKTNTENIYVTLLTCLWLILLVFLVADSHIPAFLDHASRSNIHDSTSCPRCAPWLCSCMRNRIAQLSKMCPKQGSVSCLRDVLSCNNSTSVTLQMSTLDVSVFCRNVKCRHYMLTCKKDDVKL